MRSHSDHWWSHLSDRSYWRDDAYHAADQYQDDDDIAKMTVFASTVSVVVVLVVLLAIAFGEDMVRWTGFMH